MLKTVISYVSLLTVFACMAAKCDSDPAILAKAAISEFISNKNISRTDKRNFLEYLSYYKSEGHYQAVTPAPRELRDSLTGQAKSLFAKLVKLAKKFEVPRKNMPGSSRLSKDGEKFFDNLISFTKKQVKL